MAIWILVALLFEKWWGKDVRISSLGVGGRSRRGS
jgi:hypothetical protein